jgi:hypothetical protein
MRILAALLLIATSQLALLAPAAADDPAALDEARTRWNAAAISDYRYSYRKFCVCYNGEPPEVVVTVTGGRVSDAYSRHADSASEVSATEGRLDLYWTMSDLFDKLAAAYARGATVEAEYEPGFGYPVRVFIDDFADFAGEETDVRLTGFEIL